MRQARHYSAVDQASDDYNPVTDLVFTLFAVAMLLLAVVGSDGAIREQALTVRLAALDEEVAELRARPGAARPSPRRDEAASGATEEIAALRDELDRLRQTLQAAERIVSRRDKIETLSPPSSGRFLVGARLDEGIADDILIALGQKLETIEKMDANRISFEVDIAPRLAAAPSSEEDIEYEESLALARALTLRLRRSPLPFACFAVVPFGKSRAASLEPLSEQAGSSSIIGDFEWTPDGPDDLSESRAVLRDFAPFDDRIVVVAEHLVTAPCLSADLVAGIQQWLDAR